MMSEIFGRISADQPVYPILQQCIHAVSPDEFSHYGLSTIVEGTIHESSRKQTVEGGVLPGNIGIAQTYFPRFVTQHFPLLCRRRRDHPSCAVVVKGTLAPDSVQYWQDVLHEEGYHFADDNPHEILPHLFDHLSLAHPDWLNEVVLEEMQRAVEGEYAFLLINNLSGKRICWATRGVQLVYARNGLVSSHAGVFLTPDLQPRTGMVVELPLEGSGFILTNTVLRTSQSIKSVTLSTTMDTSGITGSPTGHKIRQTGSLLSLLLDTPFSINEFCPQVGEKVDFVGENESYYLAQIAAALCRDTIPWEVRVLHPQNWSYRGANLLVEFSPTRLIHLLHEYGHTTPILTLPHGESSGQTCLYQLLWIWRLLAYITNESDTGLHEVIQALETLISNPQINDLADKLYATPTLLIAGSGLYFSVGRLVAHWLTTLAKMTVGVIEEEQLSARYRSCWQDWLIFEGKNCSRTYRAEREFTIGVDLGTAAVHLPRPKWDEQDVLLMVMTGWVLAWKIGMRKGVLP